MAGVLAALVAETAGGTPTVYAGIGVVAGLAYIAVLATVPFRKLAPMRRNWHTLFPNSGVRTLTVFPVFVLVVGIGSAGTGPRPNGQRAKKTPENPGGTPPHQRRRMR